MPIRRHVHISGRVQGVFFRDTCRQRARTLGVTGWVRNAPSGDVEAVFEGEADAVDQMVDWCRQGPSCAVVTGVRVVDEQARGERAFVVR